MVNNENQDESQPRPEDEDANMESSLEETTHIESPAEGPSAESAHSGDSTLIPVEGTTKGADSKDLQNTTSDSNHDDLDATVANLEATVHVEDDDVEATAVIDKTVAEGVEQTVAMESEDSIGESTSHNLSTDPPTVYAGKSRRGKANETVRDAQDETADGFDSNPSVETVDPSILASADIGETINPRELSKKDAKAWGSAVGVRAGGSSKTRDSDQNVNPKRTLVDQSFGRLRRRDVASLKSEPSVADDYRLVRKLGQGGMGDVFVARQGSLDRLLALKLIKPLDGKRRSQLEKTGKLAAVEEERRQQFLSEAIVTGDLDHPNIVPIHDVALTSSNELFYVMKRVVGKPWSKEIKKNSQDENIEILLKAADAIAFAHERGVVHRDIKPENIMLGDFGVVMVMDWGLALPTSDYEKQESIFSTSGLGGTPAFMAPEMATGPLENIGPASDIYLLGATLFMIVTGSAPHKAKNVTDCLKAVRRNTIRPVPPEKQGELLEIALKAMATDPKDRYTDVQSFQQAIRNYRSHAESIALTARAEDDLAQGQREGSYPLLSRAAFRFEEALKSWNGNQKAHEGLAKTAVAHAETAYTNGDFDLGLSLLDEQDPEHQVLIGRLKSGIAERDSHAARVSALKKLALVLVGFIILGGSAAMYVIDQKRDAAELAKQEAESARTKEEIAKNEAFAAQREAVAAQKEAETARAEEEVAKDVALAAKEKEETAKNEALAAQKEAETARAQEELAKNAALAAKEQEANARRDAEEAKAAAEKAQLEEMAAKEDALAAQAEAVRSRNRAEYEEYVSKIGLAKARLERNEADGAREILVELRDNPHSADRADGWEWRWLWRQANQSQSTETSEGPVIDLSIGPSGRLGAVALADGRVDLLKLDEQGTLTERLPLPQPILGDELASCVAISDDEGSIAIGTSFGDVVLVQIDPVELASSRVTVTRPHDGRVTDLQFVGDMWVSASKDRTVRLLDAETGTELTRRSACWHILPVRQVAVVLQGETLLLAAAIADENTGQVAMWRLQRRGQEIASERLGTLTEHKFPVSAVAISADGRLVASGDLGGNLLTWDPMSVPAIDYSGSIQGALDRLRRGEMQPSDTRQVRTAVATPLIDVSPENTGGSITRDSTSEGLVLMQPDHGQTDPDQLNNDQTHEDHAGQAHQDMVQSIRFSRDGKYLATAADDYTVKVWDLSRRAVEKTLKGHGGWVVGAEFLGGDDKRVVSASNDATVRTWSPSTYVGAFKVQQLRDTKAEVSASGSASGNLLGDLMRQTRAHQDEIWSASFSNDGTRVVTASQDHTARVLSIDPETLQFRELAQLNEEVLAEGSSFVAMSLQIDRPHSRLYVGSADSTIRVWDLNRGTQLSEASGTGLNSSFAVSKDGKWMLTGSSKAGVKAILWQLDPEGREPPGNPRDLPRANLEEATTAFAISPDSKVLFTGDRLGIGMLWDASTMKPIGEPIENVRTFRINAAQFSPDGSSLLLAADNAALTIVDVKTRETVSILDHIGYVTKVALSDDGRHAMTVSEVTTNRAAKAIATLWDIRTGKGLVLDRFVSPLSDAAGNRRRARITSAGFDGKGELIAVSRAGFASQPPQVRLWRMESLKGSSEFAEPAKLNEETIAATRSTVSGNAFMLPSVLGTAEAVVPIDDNSMLTMNKNAVFKWDLASKRMVRSYRAHAELTEADFSFDGKYVVTASRSVKIWNAETGQALAKIESPRPIRSVQFSPVAEDSGGYLIATGGDEGVARFWSFDPNSQKVTPVELNAPRVDARSRVIRRVRFSNDGRQLLFVGDDGLAQIIHRFDPEKFTQLVVPGNENLRCAALSDDGLHVAAGSVEKHVVIWRLPDAETKPATVVLDGHAGVINDLKLLGTDINTLRVLTASSDDTARVWDPRIDVRDDDGNPVGGREIISLRRHRGDVTAIDATKDGNLLLTAGRDGNVILWPAEPPRPNLFEGLGDEKREMP